MNTAPDPVGPGPEPAARPGRTRAISVLAAAGALLPWAITVLPLWVMWSGRRETSFGLPFGDTSAVGQSERVLSIAVMGFALLVAAFSFAGRPRRLWAIAVAVAALALTGMMLMFAGTTIMWDGVDDQGRLTGGMLRAVPGPGMVPVGMSVVCLLVAAVLAFVPSRRQ